MAIDSVRRESDLGSLLDFAAYLPEAVRRSLCCTSVDVRRRLMEVRLRLGKPVILVLNDGERLLGHTGLCRPGEDAIVFTRSMRDEALQLLTDRSVYAAQEELRLGYLTIAGGHRVGVVGRAVVDGGVVETITDISGINYRVARDVRQSAAALVRHVLGGPLGVRTALIYSPPGCGKTTVLRDLARRLSDGVGCHRSFRVSIVDERSELAGCYCGIPQRDIGQRTDVLDRAPKAVGIMMVIRSMSPEVIITDELGRLEDVHAVEECMNAGVALIASAHAGSLGELSRRPAFAAMLSRGYFDRYVRLCSAPTVGTIAEVHTAEEAIQCAGWGMVDASCAGGGPARICGAGGEWPPSNRIHSGWFRSTEGELAGGERCAFS
jgi:stage III sporulation protein AA